MEQRIAACACGTVRLRLAGPPIMTAVCYCDDCQAGARKMEAMGAAPGFHDAWGGTPYVTVRDDSLAVVQGEDRLVGVKLREHAPTTRYLATCCNTPVYLKRRPGWWTSVYCTSLGEDAPPIQARGQTRHAAGPRPLPGDVPSYRSFPPQLLAKLTTARLAMWLAPRR
jgi:hypothetical protein